MIVHGTRRFRDRVPGAYAVDDAVSTTWLGAWYATVLRWRRPVALLVNETILLPVFTRLAPARTFLERLPDALGEVLAAHGAPPALVADEHAGMADCRLAATTNRSVVGVMNEFTFLADVERAHTDVDPAGDQGLLVLSVRLASTPCGPLYARHVSLGRELAALVTEHPSAR